MAELHPRLIEDCYVLGRFPLCHLLLMNDSHYPWFILVPDRENISEIYELTVDDQKQLVHESCQLSENLKRCFHADKINVAALGNMIPQLHVHHVVRYLDDPAWPAPVWGKLDETAYSEEELNELIVRFREMQLNDFLPGSILCE